MHENRHVMKGIQHSVAERSSVLHEACTVLLNSFLQEKSVSFLFQKLFISFACSRQKKARNEIQ